MSFKAEDFMKEVQHVDLGESPLFFSGERRDFDNEIVGIRQRPVLGVEVLMGFPQEKWHFIRPQTMLTH